MRAALTGACLLLVCTFAVSAELKQGELTYNADKINSELRTDTMDLIGNVSFAQGENSITADRARVKASGEDVTQWDFQGSVHVRTIDAELRADRVRASIIKGQLSTARAEGSPAEFQQLSGTADGRGQGRADTIEYDVNAGVIKLTGGAEQVWFVYGKEKNEFRTDVLTYNMRTGTVSTGRTRGTIRRKGESETRSDTAPTTDGREAPETGTPPTPGNRT